MKFWPRASLFPFIGFSGARISVRVKLAAAANSARVWPTACALLAMSPCYVANSAFSMETSTLDAPAGGPSFSSAARCDQIAHESLQDGMITSTAEVRTGHFDLPQADRPGMPNRMEVPAFCRVSAILKPTADSSIKMEIWLPDHWNGKFMMVGNGGWSGAISYTAMAEPLRRGYAVASTDTGHEGASGKFALEHPEKLVDFAWRAVHETTVRSKEILSVYYSAQPKHSYWNGCSSGGKQGLKELQQFPSDYDGAITGAPANNWMRLQTQSIEATIANLPLGGPPILGPHQFEVLHEAVVAKCDELDGVKDGEIADPRSCHFKAASIVCKPGQPKEQCLTPEQSEVADKIYASVRNPQTHELIYPGMPPGSEREWPFVTMRPWETGVDTYKYVVFKNPAWDYRSLDLVRDVDFAEKEDIGIRATSPDLSAFRARGGKLIQYHGWSDAFIPTENSVNYYESVVAHEGGLTSTKTFYRLFLVPAMGHCAGAYSVDWISALEDWVEGGRAPETVIATRLKSPGQPLTPPPKGGGPTDHPARPLCAYPAVAHYLGTDSADNPKNYECQIEPRGSRAEDEPERLGAPISPTQ